jgi:hypothetical protein
MAENQGETMKKNSLNLTPKMTRSDLLLAAGQITNGTTKDELEKFIGIMYFKLEQVYGLLFDIELAEEMIKAQSLGGNTADVVSLISKKLRNALEA